MNNIKKFIKRILLSNIILERIYGGYATIKRNITTDKMKKKFAVHSQEVFSDFCKVCNELSIEFWLCYGTLLGYVRENGILKCDYDFDFGVWNTEDLIKLQKKLDNAGFTKVREFEALGGYDAKEFTVAKNDVFIDVFVHYKNESKIWTHVFYQDLEDYDLHDKGIFKIRKLDYPKSDLERIVFNGQLVYIPTNKEEYLTEMYGTNWKIPDPHYDWHKGPKAHCTVPNVYGICKTKI